MIGVTSRSYPEPQTPIALLRMCKSENPAGTMKCEQDIRVDHTSWPGLALADLEPPAAYDPARSTVIFVGCTEHRPHRSLRPPQLANHTAAPPCAKEIDEL